MKIENIKLKTNEGVEILLSLDEAKELYQELGRMFSGPTYFNPYYPTGSVVSTCKNIDLP